MDLSLHDHDPTPASERDPLERLADEFLAAHRRGEQLTAAEYAARHPEFAKAIEQLFPTLLALEQAGPQGVREAFGLLGDPHPQAPPNKCIGDYLLLRELGRGAMGIVYEARQRSLDRHVALKVLPWHATADRNAVERFRREAKAAARLHHTNIVPVFEVGEDADTCFYAMQFIEGQSLDRILIELRRLQKQTQLAQDATHAAASVENLALSLRSGTLLPPSLPAEPLAEQNADTARLAAAETLKSQAAEKPALGLTTESKQHYFESVARIGRQIAEALAYAHGRGVIHRDIKPSNVLLDAAGVAWVTDFGLAKTEEAAITRTGDILGTLRYMAPERFQGECHAAADVYALGVTLYEMLVLRPPHASTDRAELIAQVTQRDPLPVRALEPAVPRDLEQIVLKAMERDPQHRYASAAALADDLRRFLADEPILARRISPVERFTRWARHNRLLATTTIGTGLILIAVAIAASWASASFHALAVQERDARRDTTSHLYRALTGEAKATRLARQEGYRERVFGLLTEARQLDSEAVNLAELRSEAIQTLGDFVGLRPLVIEHFDAPVTAAVASPDGALVVVGLASGSIEWRSATTGEVQHKRTEHFAAITQLGFANATTLISCDARGVVRSWERKGDSWQSTLRGDTRLGILAQRLDVLGRMLVVHGESPSTLLTVDDLTNKRGFTVDPGRMAKAVVFSHDGNHLAAASESDVWVWETSRGRLVKRATASLGRVTSLAFAPDNQHLLATCEQGVAVFDLPDLRQTSFTRCEEATAGTFSSDAMQIAFATVARRVTVWSVYGNREVATLWHPGLKPIHTVSISANQRRLLSADADSVRIWSLADTPERLQLAGHAGAVTALSFSAAGDRLLTGGNDGLVALWNTSTGERITTNNLNAPIESVALSPKGQLMLAGTASGKLHLLSGELLRYERDVPHGVGTLTRVTFTSDGRRWIASGSGGLAVGNVVAREGASTLEDSRSVTSESVEWFTVDPENQFLFWITAKGEVQAAVLENLAPWPCRTPLALPVKQNLTVAAEGSQLLFVDQSGQLVAWDYLADQAVATLGERDPLRGRQLATSTGMRWLAVAVRPQQIGVWDVHRREQLFALRPEMSALSVMAFSPNGSLLAAGTQEGQLCLWKIQAIRDQLANIGLDWDDAALASPPTPPKGNVLEAISEALAQRPDSAMLYVRRAQLLERQGEIDKVLSDLNQAVKLDKASELPLITRAKIFARQGRWREAGEDAQSAAALQPEALELSEAAALYLARAGQRERYAEVGRKVIERFGATVDPAVAARVLRSCLLLPEAVDPAALPRAALEDAVLGQARGNIDRAEAFVTLALLELRSKRPDDALTWLRRAQREESFSKTPELQAVAFLLQAQAEREVHKPQIARESLKAAEAFHRGAGDHKSADGLPSWPTLYDILLPQVRQALQ
jgi:serine/threonine protein kinase/WD40 repeat protein